MGLDYVSDDDRQRILADFHYSNFRCATQARMLNVSVVAVDAAQRRSGCWRRAPW
jgi:hypothetical protein